MFWYKKTFSVLIAVLILTINSCIDKTSPIAYSITDTVAINSWKKNFDTLFKQYRNSNDIKFIKQASPYADSLLQNDKQILSDTNFRKIYLSVLFNYAAGLNVLENFLKSRKLFEQYIFLSGKYNLKTNIYLSYAQLNLANIYSRYGDYKKAVLLLQQSLKYYSEVKDTTGISSTILNLAIPLKELQRYNEAVQTLQQLFNLPTAAQKRKLKAHIELADIYIRQQKNEEAGLHIQNAMQLLPAIAMNDDKADIYRLVYKIEGDWHTASNNPQKALTAYQQSLDSAKKASAQNLRDREIGKTYIAMGKALEQLHYSDAALTFYNKALYTVINIDTLNKFSLPRQKDIYAENTIAEALFARANCNINRSKENMQELENAVDCYKLAFAAESKLLHAFSYDESRLYMVGETRKQTEKAISTCYQLYKKTNNANWANEAFLFAEHNKAFVLAEAVRRNTAALLFLQNDTLYAKMQLLQNNLALTEIALGKQNFSAAADTVMIQSLNAAKQKTEEELLAAENNIRIKNPQYNDWISDETTFSAEEIINKTLSDKTSLVEYFSGDSSLYAFSAEKNKPLNFYKLSDSVKNITEGFLHFFSNQNLILNTPALYAAAANHLYQSILGPYLPQGNTRVLIIPDGFTAYIPFDALLTNSTASNNIASFPFLIKQQQTYYAFSCKTLLAQAQNKNSEVDNLLVAFAPVFANKERGLSSLMHSNEELKTIKQFYPQGKFFNGGAATLKTFKENSGNASIIHLATHASLGNDTIPARIELYDSSIYINSIYTQKIKAKLVVLSGCQTGTGAINKTEGLMSLARGFSYAGTKNVIASLWQTEDNSSAAIFKNFYSNISDNNFSSALHQAKLSVLNKADVAAASPYYWSGYIYIGSPDESLSPPSWGKLQLIAAFTGLVLITSYFIFVRRRRQKLIR
jgi:CHAT domain-containing protein